MASLMKPSNLRALVAREAARLLYYRLATEYKFAKLKAARELGVSVLPSNREVADELDALASLLEGESRIERLVQMRREALALMEAISEFDPKLIGSVWRGTVRIGSDIDIIVYSRSPSAVIEKLKRTGYRVVHVESKVKAGKELEGKKVYLHIYVELKSGNRAEIVVRSPEDQDVKEICDIYGDVIEGLTIDELRRVLAEDPTRRFIPQR